MANTEKWGTEIKKWGRCQPTCYCLIFYVASLLSSQLSVYSKLCIMSTLLHFRLLCQSCHSLRNISLGGRIVGLIKSNYHGWLSVMTSSEGPLFSLASGPPNLKPTTACASYAFYLAIHTCICKEGRKIGKVMTRRVANKHKSKIHNRELKTRPLSLREYLIVMFKMLYFP